MKTLLNKISKKPINIFLIDGLGAFLTAFFIFVIIAQFEDSFGMPKKISYYLSLIALLYCLYSFTCFFSKVKNWKIYLKIIIIGNLLYSLLTITLCFFYYQVLSPLGLIYFLIELIIVGILVWFEYRLLYFKEY